MTTSKKKSEKGKKTFSRDPNMLYLPGIEGKNDAESNAVFSHNTALRATCGGKPFRDIILPGGDATESLKTLVNRSQKVRDGDMTSVEAILVAQADTLDAVFNALLLRAIGNQTNLQHFEGLMRMALKAQAQCSLTLRTLSEIMNPRQGATFVRQMNNAGQQVVNNNIAGAQETGKMPNELLSKGESVEAVDKGGKTAAIEAHSRLDTMEEINRPQDNGREKEILPKCEQGRL